MITYAYYGLIAIYCIILLVSLFYFVTQPKPHGDATVDWAWAVMYSIGLLVFTAIAALLWKKQTAGFIVLLIPIVIVLMPRIRRMMTDAYAAAPTTKNIPQLTLEIKNTTPAMVHVRLNCWFATGDRGTTSLYKTLDYNLDPMESKTCRMTDYDTGLLAQKSANVSVQMFELVHSEHEGTSFITEVQPCMQFYDEPIEAFQTGHYTIVIDSTKNTDTFKQEVAYRKSYNGYGSGVF